jgi:hypothetical protein
MTNPENAELNIFSDGGLGVTRDGQTFDDSTVTILYTGSKDGLPARAAISSDVDKALTLLTQITHDATSRSN